MSGREPGTLGEWLSAGGPEGDVVMSTRIRLARNVADYPFLGRIDERRKAALERELREKLGACLDAPVYHDLEAATPVDRQCLVEGHVISRDLAQGRGARGVAVGPGGVLSVMVNEEDHLRVQVLRAGLAPDAAWSEILAADRRLEGAIDFAFSPELGYLTACPTNVGTAMRVSVMLHLPALVWTKQVDKVLHAVSKINLAVRGFYGEGTQALGDFYQISNQATLGRTEEDTLRAVADYVPHIVAFERNWRRKLLAEHRAGIEDRIWRAYGMLERARLLTSEEAMEYLSALRVGVDLGLIDGVTLAAVNELFILTQPAHLQKLAGRELDTPARDEHRAAFVRGKLARLN